MAETPNRKSLIRHWSALVPIGMSMAALMMVLIFGLILRPEPQTDEGAAAHIYQLLMTLQMPIVVYFAIRWLPQRWRAALVVLVLQGLAWFASLGALYMFEHGAGPR